MNWTKEQQKEHRNKLTQELRTTECTQGKNSLRGDENTFCCLGIACELFKHITGKGLWVQGEGCWDFLLEANYTRLYLPEQVQEFYGFTTVAGNLKPIKGKKALADLNDNGYTFEQIAAIVDQEPKGLIKESVVQDFNRD